jgi:hypothetical protein
MPGTGSSTTAPKACPYGADKPIDEMDEAIRGPVLFALSAETDPKELDKMADAMEIICQASAAEALRKKSAAIKAALGKEGLPPTTDPSIVTFPIPGVAGTSPEPKTAGMPADTDSFEKLSAEPATDAESPVAGCQSLPSTQWWTGPYSKMGISLRYLAESITGNAARYVEFMIANPEKATVGDPKDALDSGYGFVSLAEGERIRVPMTWNSMLDQTGDSSGGSLYPVCVDGKIPETFTPSPFAGFGTPGGY